jgi:hypothetical protein
LGDSVWFFAAGRASVVPVARSKNGGSSTGNGITRVLFFSAATSTTVRNNRSRGAPGVSVIAPAAWASFVDAWNSPSAAIIRARRSRSASACRDVDRLIPSGSATSLTSTGSMWILQGPFGRSIDDGLQFRVDPVPIRQQRVQINPTGDRPWRGLRHLRHNGRIVLLRMESLQSHGLAVRNDPSRWVFPRVDRESHSGQPAQPDSKHGREGGSSSDRSRERGHQPPPT